MNSNTENKEAKGIDKASLDFYNNLYLTALKEQTEDGTLESLKKGFAKYYGLSEESPMVLMATSFTIGAEKGIDIANKLNELGEA